MDMYVHNGARSADKTACYVTETAQLRIRTIRLWI